MIILPIGHERGFVRRLPWVTITIAVLCLLLQVRASVLEPPILAEAERLTAEVRQIELERKALRSGHKKAPSIPGLDLTGLPSGLSELAGALPSEDKPHEETDDEKALRQERVAALEREIVARTAQRDALLETLPTMRLGFRPKDGGVVRMITSAFAHGGWMHLLGNLLFLYLVGCNIEDRWGRLRFALFYLVSAVLSAWAFRMWHPGSEQVLVGASGSIAAVMGAFTVCLARTRISFFYAFWIAFKPRWGTFDTPAWVALPLWFAQQALMSVLEARANLGVAYSAHVGGFVFGALVAAGMRWSGADQRLAEKAEFSDEEGAQWSDDPVFAEAQGLALEGHRAAALSALEELLSRLPDHEGANELALKLSLQVGDDERIRTHATSALTQWARTGKTELVVERYRAIREQRPELALSEGALRAVVAATARDDADARVVIDVAGLLIRQHPGSPLLPRVMWLAAGAQERLSRSDLAQTTLENLAATFPMDPFGERARRKLHGESLRPPRTA